MDAPAVIPTPTVGEFFFVGGTVPSDAACYVTRHADSDLIEHLRRGKFCYVLNTRQLGKSSLMVRTANLLQAEGITVAVLDLTAIGNNLTPEQWYDGLLLQLALRLDRDVEMMDFWDSHERLGPMQRWNMALQQVILPHIDRLVIFVDEIDAVRSLPFPADEFFGAIRECYNRRTIDPIYNKLTYCLIGVATPSDLIADARISPFNIGHRIELGDFTPQEVAPLAAGLNTEAAKRGDGRYEAETLLARILTWTGGHPYMTQRLCQVITERLASVETPMATEESLPRRASLLHPMVSPSVALVDSIVEERFLSKAAISTDDNLAFVRNRLLHREMEDESEQAALLDMYLQVRTGKTVKYDEVNPLCSRLRLSGVCRVVQGELKLRNRIYQQVFDSDWVYANMPGAELRRQQAAYRRGVLRTAAIAALLLLVIGTLALTAVSKASEAQMARKQADRLNTQLQSTNRSLQVALQAQQESNVKLQLALQDSRVQRHDAQTQAQRARKEAANALRQSRLADQHRREAESAQREASVQKSEALRQKQIAAERLSRAYVADGMRLLANRDVGAALAPLGEALRLDQNDPRRERMHRIRLAHTLSRMPRLVNMLSAGSPILDVAYSADYRRFVTATRSGIARVWDAETFRPITPDLRHPAAVACVEFSPDGTRLATGCANGTIRLWNANTGHPLSPPKRAEGDIRSIHWSADGKRVAAAAANEAAVWDGDTGNDISWNTMIGANLQDVGFSPDRKRLTLACAEYICSCMDTETTLHDTTFADKYTAYSTQFCRDGRRVLLGGGFGWSLFDASTGQLLQHEPTLPGRVEQRVRLSPDETRIVAVYADDTIRVWDARSAEPITPPMHHQAQIHDARFSPDGNRILTCSEDGTAQVWDATTGEPLTSPLRHAGNVTAAKFDSTGQHVLTVGKDGLARLWDLRSASPQAQTIISKNVSSLLVTQDRKWLIAPSFGNDDQFSLEVYDAHTGRAWLHHDANEPFFLDCTINTAQTELLAWNKDKGTARCWDMRTGQQIPLHMPPQLGAIAISPDTRLLLNQTQDGMTTVYDLRHGGIVCGPFRTSPGYGQLTCTWYPDSRHLLQVAPDGSLWQRDILAAALRRLTPPTQAEVVALAMESTGHYLYLRMRDGKIVFYEETQEGGLRYILTIPSIYHGRILTIIIDPKRKHAILANPILHSIDIANLTTGQVWHSPITGDFLHSTDMEAILVVDALLRRYGQQSLLAYDPNAVQHVFAVSPNENLLATEGEDTMTRICDAHTGAPLTPPLPHAGAIAAMQFSADNAMLATFTATGQAQVWDAHTGEPLTLPLSALPPQQFSPSLAFLDGGRRLCLSAGDIRIWDIDASRHSTKDLIALTQLFSGQRVDTRFGVTTTETQQITAEFARLNTRYPENFHPSKRVQSLASGTQEKEPQHAQIQSQLMLEKQARNAIDLRLWSTALPLLSQLLATSPARPDLLALEARAYGQTGQWAHALQDYDGALKAHPDDAVSWLERALVLSKMARQPEAETSYTRAEVASNILAPGRLDALSIPVEGDTRTRCEALLADCTLLLSWRGDDRLSRRVRALTSALIGDWSSAESDWQHLEALMPGSPDLHYARLYALGKQEQWGPLVNATTETLRTQPGDARLHYLRAIACTHLGHDSKAVEDATWLLTQDPGNRELLNLRWHSFRRLGRYKEAIRDFSQLHADAPEGFPRLSLTTCISLMLRADNDTTNYQQIISEMLVRFGYTGDLSTRQLLSQIGSLGPCNPNQREEWRRVAQANALSGKSSDLGILGTMLYWQGDWNGAIRTLRRAIDLHPHGGEANACVALAGAYYRTGQQALARHWLAHGQALLRRLLPTDSEGADDWDTLGLIIYQHEANRLEADMASHNAANRLSSVAYVRYQHGTLPCGRSANRRKMP